MKEKLDSVKKLRKAFQANGYIPVAVHNPNPGDKNSGKNPVGTGWQRTAITTPIRVDGSALNTGILLPDIYAIDQDADDQELSEAVEALILRHFGSMPLKRFRAGSHRFLTLFRSEGGITKQKVGRSGGARYLEVLSHGQQFVADGSHWTGAAIEWADNISPANLHKNDLPLVAPAQMTAFLIDVKALFGTPDADVSIHGYRGAETKHCLVNRPDNDNKLPIEDLAALLDALDIEDDYEEWLRVIAAIYNETSGSFEGKALAHMWSEKSTKYSQKESYKGVDKKWRSLDRSPLRQITAGTLIHKIQQQIPGWCAPSFESDVEADKKELAEALARWNKKFR